MRCSVIFNILSSPVSDLSTVKVNIYFINENNDSSVIDWTNRNFLKPSAKINLLKSPTFLGKFCKGVKVYQFSIEIMFRQLLYTFGDFFWSH